MQDSEKKSYEDSLELLVLNVMELLIDKQIKIKEDTENLKLEAQESLYLTVGQCNEIELKKRTLLSSFYTCEETLFYIQKEFNKIKTTEYAMDKTKRRKKSEN